MYVNPGKTYAVMRHQRVHGGMSYQMQPGGDWFEVVGIGYGADAQLRIMWGGNKNGLRSLFNYHVVLI